MRGEDFWLRALVRRRDYFLAAVEGWDRYGAAVPKGDPESLQKNPEERVPELADPEKIGLDLVSVVREQGAPRPLLLRPEILETLVRILHEGQAVCLRGEPGAGKSGLLWQLAYAMAHPLPGFPESLARRPLILTTATAFQFGVFYMHELENRMHLLIRRALEKRAILAVEEAHLLARAGGHETNPERTVANLLIPGIRQGLGLILLTTPEGHRYLQATAPQLAGWLACVDVPPMDREATRCILEAYIRAWEQDGVSVEGGLGEDVLEAAGRYGSEAAPGGPVRLLRRIYAGRRHPDRLSRADLERALVEITGLRPAVVSRRRPLSFREVRDFLAERIYGQPEAVDALADAVLALKAGLVRSEGPWGVFLLAGPTGVGKTELARQVTRFLFGSEDRLIRCDMGAFIGPEGLMRFLGDAYGFRRSPVEAVAAQPCSVLLLDEIEKTDRYLQDALLSILDAGRITDGRGRTVSFRQCLIIMTTNAAGQQLWGRRPGLMPHAPGLTERRVRQVLEAYFRPEFLNRIHRVIVFRPLTAAVVRRIAEREVGEVLQAAARRYPDVLIEVDGAVLDRVVADGYDPAWGARPMSRAVDRWVRSPLARFLAEHPDVRGGRLRLRLSADGTPEVGRC